jgi:hypothetical protein
MLLGDPARRRCEETLAPGTGDCVMALQDGCPVEHRGICRHDRPDRPHRPTYPYPQRFRRTMWSWRTGTTSDVIVRSVSRHDGLGNHRAGARRHLLDAARGTVLIVAIRKSRMRTRNVKAVVHNHCLPCRSAHDHLVVCQWQGTRAVTPTSCPREQVGSSLGTPPGTGRTRASYATASLAAFTGRALTTSRARAWPRRPYSGG